MVTIFPDQCSPYSHRRRVLKFPRPAVLSESLPPEDYMLHRFYLDSEG
jgi:hypothetical protein